MKYTDVWMPDFADPGLQNAFRAYFGELGVQVRNWEGLFEEMSAGIDAVLVRKDGNGAIVGFLMLAATDAVTAWRGFFCARLGFIQEFWIAPEYRGKGHGGALLQLAEAQFAAQGCGYAILTTDTAAAFYEKHGYRLQKGITAKNQDDVYLKVLA